MGLVGGLLGIAFFEKSNVARPVGLMYTSSGYATLGRKPDASFAITFFGGSFSGCLGVFIGFRKVFFLVVFFQVHLSLDGC